VHRVGLEYLFLVGGFAESPILQFEIRKEFEHRVKIVIPQEVSLTILKGTTTLHGGGAALANKLSTKRWRSLIYVG